MASRLPLLEFGRACLPHYMKNRPSRFHLELVAELDTLTKRRGSRRAWIAPRGSAKSTWTTLAYPLREALRGTERHIVLLSDSSDQASQLLAAIRTELEGNQWIRDNFAAVAGAGSEWTNRRIMLRNGVVIEALGTGSKIRGRRNRQDRPTLMIVDDPQGNQDIVSKVERQRSWDWMVREVIPAGTDGHTNFLAVGTALHREAIIVKLQQTAGWVGKTYRSIERWPDRMDLWDEWGRMAVDWGLEDRPRRTREFYERNRAAMDQGAEVLWPEGKPLYDLMLRRAEIGPIAFDTEDQGVPHSEESTEWPAEWFDRSGIWFTAWPRMTVMVIALDPSKGSDSKKGDYSAFVALGRAVDGTIYVEADIRRRSTDLIVDHGFELCDRVSKEIGREIDGFGIESDQFQELLANQFIERSKGTGFMRLIYKMTTGGLPKEVRIRKLTPLFASNVVRFRDTPGTRLLVEQLRDFPNGDHDDGPDAMDYARRLAVYIFNRRAKR
jgi:predicted phage terminase large subunit-like protein